MFRSLVRPAAVGSARLAGLPLGLVVGALSRRCSRAAQARRAAPAAQAAGAEASPFVFCRRRGVVLNFIKPDKTADFEMVMGKLKEALAKSEKPERKQQAAGWKVFKADRARPAAPCIYVFVIDPVVKGADYSVSNILAGGVSRGRVNTIYARRTADMRCRRASSSSR